MNLTRIAALALGSTVAVMGAIAPSAQAEDYSIPAYCEYTEYGNRTPTAAMPCSFAYIANGYEIVWQDGVYNRFNRASDSSEHFTDVLNGSVYRYYNEFTGSTIFEMESGEVEVYIAEGCAH